MTPDPKELAAVKADRDDWKARALKAEQVGEPFGWYSAKEDDFMLDKIRKTHERLNSHTHRIGKYDLALYTTPPRPAAQEPFAWARPDAVDTSQDFRFIKIDDFTVPLYATPPRPAAQEPFAWARPDAVDTSQDFRFIKIDDFTVPLYTTPPSAVPVVEQLVEALSRNRIMAADSDGNYTREVTPRVITAAIAAGQKFIKENGK